LKSGGSKFNEKPGSQFGGNQHPDAIVLGGGLSNLARLYENVPKLWGPYIFTDRVVTRFLKNRHGDSSGVRGAAWL